MPIVTHPEYFDLPEHLLRYHDLVEQQLQPELDSLHKPTSMVRSREADQRHPIIQRFYQVFNRPPYNDHMHPIQRAYVRIARHMADELEYQGSTFYQAVPCCRVQQPGDLAVGHWHTDAEYGHQPQEVNVFMPIWDTNDHNTIHIEYEGKQRAYPVKRGQVLVFMGAKWQHGNVFNRSKWGRLSFDFRLLASTAYTKGGRTINGSRTFELGSYWNELSAGNGLNH